MSLFCCLNAYTYKANVLWFAYRNEHYLISNLWVTKLGLLRTYLSHLTQAVEWWKIHLLRKLANIDDHRDGTFISKLTPESLFLFKMSGFIFLLFTAVSLLNEVARSVYMKSVPFFSVSKVNNGVQKFLIYPNNYSKCAISRDDV